MTRFRLKGDTSFDAVDERDARIALAHHFMDYALDDDDGLFIDGEVGVEQVQTDTRPTAGLRASRLADDPYLSELLDKLDMHLKETKLDRNRRNPDLRDSGDDQEPAEGEDRERAGEPAQNPPDA